MSLQILMHGLSSSFIVELNSYNFLYVSKNNSFFVLELLVLDVALVDRRHLNNWLFNRRRNILFLSNDKAQDAATKYNHKGNDPSHNYLFVLKCIKLCAEPS